MTNTSNNNILEIGLKKIVKAYKNIVCHPDHQNFIQCMTEELLRKCKNIHRYKKIKWTVLTEKFLIDIVKKNEQSNY